jgi:predicted RNase H-like nuclease (RuvC/YqgF family)
VTDEQDARVRQRVARFERAASLAGIDPGEFDAVAVITAAGIDALPADEDG